MKKETSDEKKQMVQTTAIMGRLAAMPHKPHVVKKKAAKAPRKPKDAR